MRWAAEAFRGIDRGDKRRDRRAVKLVERLAELPTASIPGACNGWAETQAAYRFLRSEDCDWLEILAAHRPCTCARIAEQRVVLCIQDTTELDCNGQAIAGLGPLSYAAPRGLYVHPTQAVSPRREPLGEIRFTLPGGHGRTARARCARRCMPSAPPCRTAGVGASRSPVWWPARLAPHRRHPGVGGRAHRLVAGTLGDRAVVCGA